jgi:hypothetical protein
MNKPNLEQRHWVKIYSGVVVFLIVLIIVFYLITKHYQ